MATGGGVGAVVTGSCGDGAAGLATGSAAADGVGSATGCGTGSVGVEAGCVAGSSDWITGGCLAAFWESEAGVSSFWAQPAASSNSRTAEPAYMTNFAAIMVPDGWAQICRVFITPDRLQPCLVVRASFRRQAVLSAADRQQPDSDHPDDRRPQARRPTCPSSGECSAW